MPLLSMTSALIVGLAMLISALLFPFDAQGRRRSPAGQLFQVKHRSRFIMLYYALLLCLALNYAMVPLATLK